MSLKQSNAKFVRDVLRSSSNFSKFAPIILQNANAKLPSVYRQFSSLPYNSSRNQSSLTYFKRNDLPVNTIIRFVPQQTAWVVERMGKFNR